MLCVILFLLFVTAASAKKDGTCSDLHCSHACSNEEDIPKCVCPIGLILGPDSKTCEEQLALLLLTNKGLQLFKEGKSENEFQSVFSNKTYSFDYYFSKKEIYAFVGDEIIRYTFADSNLQGKPLLTKPIVQVDTRVTSIAVDWKHSQLYWVCRQRSLVETASTDGSGRKEIVSYEEDNSSAEWNDLAVDPYAEKLIWLGSKGLYICDFHGQHNVTSLSLHHELLTLDLSNQLIYIIGHHGSFTTGKKVVARYHYDGSQLGEEIIIGQAGSTVFGFEVFGNKLYWESNYLGENIYKTDIDNISSKNKITLVEELYQILFGFKVYHPKIQQPPKEIK